MSDEQLSEFGALKRPVRRHRSGAGICTEHERNDAVYIVRTGWAVASTVRESGRRQILRFAMPGSLIGFETAPDGTMPCTVEALTDLTVCSLSRGQLLRFCEGAPNVALRMASLLAGETISDWRLLGGLGCCSAAERIARLLLDLGDRQHRAGARETPPDTDAVLPISQIQIADATGLTPVHVCRTLKEMREAGLLTFVRQHLHVLDRSRLIALAGIEDEASPPRRAAAGELAALQ
ncbi:Crp/Fnr family transcriptional regulator (plasmid) [Skermanella mucosa]|uniref:Crp/Fnr family transcriptional regulator n=1 Tax=Skermanella mucosa TaxID=1789672 RepID=UPI00192B0CA3|nr:Crp/Fnr family transcriptional regulator [Skermanella mucosa]UEM25304.1 Crp/Fnr family transcriptional regulator [Skermanella mucosa]